MSSPIASGYVQKGFFSETYFSKTKNVISLKLDKTTEELVIFLDEIEIKRIPLAELDLIQHESFFPIKVTRVEIDLEEIKKDLDEQATIEIPENLSSNEIPEDFMVKIRQQEINKQFEEQQTWSDACSIM